jgi:class 3 adenylate cyclase
VDPQSVKRRLTCILAADAVGYSQQMGRDEEGTIRVLTAHRAVIDGLIDFHGGRIMSTAGDSVLAEFASVVEAVRCAVEIQEALKTSNDALAEDERMQFRVGVNLGDVVVKNDDLLGDGVNVAARLETIAEPGGICISSSVYDQITGKLDLGFQDIGEQALKNISRPIRVYRVSGTGVPLRPAAPPKARRAGSSFPWGIAAGAVVVIAGAGAWQAGLLHFGATEPARPGSVVAPAPSATPAPGAPTSTAGPAGGAMVSSASTTGAGSTPAPSTDAEAQRLRADAEAMRKQAREDLSRARSEVEAARAAKNQSDAEAAAGRVRAQAEADAARIRADAEAARVSAKIASEPAPREAEVRAAKSAPASAAADTRFDGAWSVLVTCAATTTASGYKFDFIAQVKSSRLQGERRVQGEPGWMKLQGTIPPDGNATLDASGLTDNPKYAGNNVASGSPYSYHVAARFDGNRGSGHRVELRPCDLQFAKQ